MKKAKKPSKKVSVPKKKSELDKTKLNKSNTPKQPIKKVLVNPKDIDTNNTIYFPVKSSQIHDERIYCDKTKYRFKLLHTSLDKLVRYLQLNNLKYKYYTIIPIDDIPIAKNRYNLEGEVSAILPFNFKLSKVYKLDYDDFRPQKMRYGTEDIMDTAYLPYTDFRTF